MLNAATEGKSWGERKIKLSQIVERNKLASEGSETLWQYAFENFIKPNVESGKIVEE